MFDASSVNQQVVDIYYRDLLPFDKSCKEAHYKYINGSLCVTIRKCFKGQQSKRGFAEINFNKNCFVSIYKYKISSYKVESDNKYFEDRDNCIYLKQRDEEGKYILIAMPNMLDGDVKLPDDISYIASSCIILNDNIKSLTLPLSFKKLYTYALPFRSVNRHKYLYVYAPSITEFVEFEKGQEPSLYKNMFSLRNLIIAAPLLDIEKLIKTYNEFYIDRLCLGFLYNTDLYTKEKKAIYINLIKNNIERLIFLALELECKVLVTKLQDYVQNIVCKYNLTNDKFITCNYNDRLFYLMYCILYKDTERIKDVVLNTKMQSKRALALACRYQTSDLVLFLLKNNYSFKDFKFNHNIIEDTCVTCFKLIYAESLSPDLASIYCDFPLSNNIEHIDNKIKTLKKSFEISCTKVQSSIERIKSLKYLIEYNAIGRDLLEIMYLECIIYNEKDFIKFFESIDFHLTNLTVDLFKNSEILIKLNSSESALVSENTIKYACNQNTDSVLYIIKNLAKSNLKLSFNINRSFDAGRFKKDLIKYIVEYCDIEVNDLKSFFEKKLDLQDHYTYRAFLHKNIVKDKDLALELLDYVSVHNLIDAKVLIIDFINKNFDVKTRDISLEL